MLVRVDREADAVYLELTSAPIEESEEVADGVVLDYDKDGNLVGIEILWMPRKKAARMPYGISMSLPELAPRGRPVGSSRGAPAIRGHKTVRMPKRHN
ncbi:MAG: DUF2283 domain-containing protein [Acidithiobacillus ferrooxidans]